LETEQTYPCPECQVGALHPRRVSYFTSDEGHPLCVPDFPAWVCDVCGRREYDSAALAELRAVLETERRSRRQPRRRIRPGGDVARPPSDPAHRT
jgi:YgiT-type zinc finger domain-containing protein